MPQPWTYSHASREYRSFLDDVKARGDLVSDNMAYTAIEGVLLTFRKRLQPREVITFANQLPSVLRAIFLYNWDPLGEVLPFASRDEMNKEAQSLRPHHNLTPNHAIEVVAWALWRHVNHRQFNAMLNELPKAARLFWEVDAPATELRTKII